MMKNKTHAGCRRLLCFLLPLVPGAALAQITLTDTPVLVDNNAPEYLERFFQVNDDGLVESVRVTIDFQAVNAPGTSNLEICDDPAEGNGWANEVAFRLTSPEGTSVYLITNRTHDELDPTYAGSVAADHQTPRVQVTFDDEAAERVGSTNRGIPESGTFQPMEPLSAMAGEPAQGTWTLGMQDDAHFHPLCYYSATLQIDTE